MKIALVLLLLCACGKSEKVPTCAEVTDHVLGVVQVKYPGHGDMGAGGNRQDQINSCEARKMSAGERRCILAAKTMEAIAECRRASVKKEAGSATTP
jgi:hypothetical protein